MSTAVFDCMVFLQAVTRPTGPAAACLTLVEESKVRLFLSPGILDELRNVLVRPATQRKFPRLTEEKADKFIKKVLALASFVEDVPATVQLARDPKDQPYLNLAVTAGASFLVTRDKDLLSLVNDDAFRQSYPALTITDPVAFLAHVRADVSKELGNP